MRRPAYRAMDKTSDTAVTTIEILGREYPVRSRLNADEVSRLGTYVREKMEAVANRAPRRDLLHVAVLAALNIADDYFRSLYGRADGERHVLDRMLAIEAMVDRVLSTGKPAPEKPDSEASPADQPTADSPETPSSPADHSG